MSDIDSGPGRPVPTKGDRAMINNTRDQLAQIIHDSWASNAGGPLDEDYAAAEAIMDKFEFTPRGLPLKIINERDEYGTYRAKAL